MSSDTTSELLTTAFDRLVESGMVVYDEHQKIKKYIDHDLEFHFILTSALNNKPTISSSGPPAANGKNDNGPQLRAGSDISTTGYEIGLAGDSHILVGNKFSFARPHVLLLTSDGYERQYRQLNHQDVNAAWTLLRNLDGEYVVFYNCGRDGGCSRLHKHMQLTPIPDASFASFLDTDAEGPPQVPFQWVYRRLDPQLASVDEVNDVYNELLGQATLLANGKSEHAQDSPSDAACPHNLIISRNWMIVIPRRRASVNKEIAANALGMLGVIAVPSQAAIDQWLHLGLTNCLRDLGFPK